MSIFDLLTETQLESIVSIIRTQCNVINQHEINMELKIGQPTYTLLKKGRKTHDVTSDVYAGFFYPGNSIEGVTVDIVQNGFYNQPELRVNNVIIHIYHSTNQLNSKLVTDRRNQLDYQYFCIKYALDKGYNLKSIDSVYLHGELQEIENIYTAPDLSVLAG